MGAKKGIVLTIKVVIGALVLVMVGRHVARVWEELRSGGGVLHLETGWLVPSLLLYLMGLCGFGIFYGRILKASSTPIGYYPALRAYLISHLGKYVPGKALVVVMRVGLSTPYGARPATSAFATLYETLVMMASGGLLAGMVFALSTSRPVLIPIGNGWELGLPLMALGFAMGLPLLVLAQAKVFPKFLAVIRTPFRGVGAEALPRFSHRLLVEGMLWSAGGWALLGASQVAVIRALSPGGVDPLIWPLVIGSVALATVAGFAVAIFPGGLVIREGVLMAALGPTIGEQPAVVAALVLRLVWVLGEVVSAALLSLARPPLPSPSLVKP
ncbi:lysylphosphatidylglycerol synthase domain-containing protein [soil metagenome]